MRILNGVGRRSRAEVARRIAEDVEEGWTVNLGIGLPTLVSDYVPQGREIIFHSENGILGMGPAPASAEDIQPWLINASKKYVTLQKGGSYIHHADSFALIRGGHISLCVLGAYEVSQNGDLANWATLDRRKPPAVGGAMDLAVGAQRVWVATSHTASDGAMKLKSACVFPITGAQVVDRVYTDLAVLEPRGDGFTVLEIVEEITFDQLQEITDAPLF